MRGRSHGAAAIFSMRNRRYLHERRVVRKRTEGRVQDLVPPVFLPPARPWAAARRRIFRSSCRSFSALVGPEFSARSRASSSSMSCDAPEAAGLSSASRLQVRSVLGVAFGLACDVPKRPPVGRGATTRSRQTRTPRCTSRVLLRGSTPSRIRKIHCQVCPRHGGHLNACPGRQVGRQGPPTARGVGGREAGPAVQAPGDQQHAGAVQPGLAFVLARWLRCRPHRLDRVTDGVAGRNFQRMSNNHMIITETSWILFKRNPFS